jgi:feruloyl esterase
MTAVEVVPAVPFEAPGNPAPLPMTLPAHCRVAAVLTPSSDSRIAIEVWLPAENWNASSKLSETAAGRA